MTGVDIVTHRVRTGLHYCRHTKLKGLGRLNEFDYYTFLRLILIRAGDVELNPGPESDSETDGSSMSDEMSGIIAKNFSVVHYNVQSALHKIDFLESELANFDLISITETWFNQSISNADVNINGFRAPFRKDRLGDGYGGVAVYIKNDIPCIRRTDLEILNIECVWVEIRLHGKRLLVGTYYRPPNSDNAVLTNIENSIDLAIDTEISDIIILGDFNLDMNKPNTSNKINNICQQYNLHQLIREPTHFTERSSSIIDLILVSDPRNLLLSGVGDPFLNQDIRYHCPIYAVYKFLKPHAKSIKRHIWMYKNGNYDNLKEKFRNSDWESFAHENIDNYAENITDHIMQLTSECVPNKYVNIRQTDPPWMHNELRKLMRKRKRAYDKAKQTKRTEHWNKYKTIRNDTTNLLRSSKQTYFDNLSEKLKTNNNLNGKDWWKTLKTFISNNDKSPIPPLKDNDMIYADDNEKANLLNAYFKTQSDLNDTNKEVPHINITNHNRLSTIQTTPDEVKSIIDTLKTGKAAGPDNINNYILRTCARELSYPLSNLFNFSFSTSKVPKIWKQANVTPVFKKDDPTDCKNYRPISLLSTVGKVIEKIVHKHVFNFFKDNNVITSLQSGFVPGDSTVNQLVDIYNTFCKALDNGLEVRAIFCDISKAFDRVWHKGLLAKLKSVGITDSLLNWFQNYLRDRKQRVVLPGGLSEWENISAGVPQGSILGPLLFLVYINDIVQEINSTIRLFADDTSLYIIVESPEEAANTLNQDLNRISAWAEKWLVSFNPQKTDSMILSRKTNKPIHPNILMNNQIIAEVNHHKHLGLIFETNGSWHEHIKLITAKAWQRVHVMRKLKSRLDRKALEIIYIAFIRPILEYADIVWCNLTKYEENELEKIQLEAARIVTGTTKLISLENLYKETGWETLNSRRQQHKLGLFYKMIHGLVPPYLSLLLPPLVGENSRYPLRNSDHYQNIKSKSQLYYNSFLPSAIREWNSLDASVKSSQSVTSLKKSLSKRKLVPSYYYHGNRKSQILHTRIRTNCSSLNFYLYRKNIIQNKYCTCGEVEDTQHFFFICPQYNAIRQVMLDMISRYIVPTLDILLFGETTLNDRSNSEIFDAVQKFIIHTKRFDNH